MSIIKSIRSFSISSLPNNFVIAYLERSINIYGILLQSRVAEYNYATDLNDTDCKIIIYQYRKILITFWDKHS